jgi:putative flippase GtrA
MRRFATFLLIGGACTVLQYVLLTLGVEVFRAAPAISSSVGFVASALANYMLNYHITFRSEKRHMLAGSQFAVVACIGLLINYAAVALLVEKGRWPYMFAQVVATAIVLAWNYLANARWSFGSNVARAGLARKEREL